MELVKGIIEKNGLLFAFLLTGIIILFSFWLSNKLTNNRIPGVAIAILIALLLAFLGEEEGLGDISLFTGMALLGGSMLRDFAVVATAMGADLNKMKNAGIASFVSLFSGVFISFFIGALLAFGMGYRDTVSMTTIGAGACTYIVGPVTGAALGASSDIIAISIATGVIKTIIITVATPLVAKKIGLDNAQTAMVFGGLMGTTSGVAAGLAATNPKLVPYGALTATFYTGLGCLLCPSVFFLTLEFFF